MLREFFPKLYNPDKCFENMMMDSGAAFLIALQGVSMLLTSIIMILFPRFPVLVGSIIPDAYFILPVRLIVTSLQIYVSVSIHITTMMWVTTVYYYLCLVTPICTQELRMDGRKFKTFRRLRTPEALIKVYRSLQLLNNLAMYICGPFVVPQQMIFSKFIVYNNYMQIVYSHQISLATASLLGFWALGFSFYWTVVLSFGGYLYCNTNRVLLSWKYHNWDCKKDTKLMSKFRKSCTPITIHFGTTFVIKRLTLLKFIRGATVSTFRILLIGRRR
ncbi:unnamed protein product [Orchesella dallaii]|uniref:Uncharacterized protein n=1 Tax=Orchesella dallaii TaxID=48710 RepID=A0ABP1PNT4_9HEXA